MDMMVIFSSCRVSLSASGCLSKTGRHQDQRQYLAFFARTFRISNPADLSMTEM